MQSQSAAWTSQEVERALAMVREGKTFAQIGAATGRSRIAVERKMARVRIGRIATPNSRNNPDVANAALEMENAALRAKLDKAAKKSKSAVQCEADEIPEPSIAEVWETAEADCDRRIDRARKASRFSIAFDSSKPIAIAFVSDQHIAPGTPIAMRRMREDAELINRTPGLHCVLGGDGVDNHIKHFSAVLASRSQPDDQWRLFDHYLDLLGEKVIVAISGNHDAWTNQAAGVDVLRRITEQKGVRYSPFEARVSVNVDGQEYKLAVRHQYCMNSSMNQLHAVQQWFRFGEEEFDVGCICHHHELMAGTFMARGLPRVGFRPGSYQTMTAYSAQYGFGTSIPACPTVVLFPGKREMVAFADVRKAADYLTYFRKGVAGSNARIAPLLDSDKK